MKVIKMQKDATTPQSIAYSEAVVAQQALHEGNKGYYQQALALGNAAVAMSDLLKKQVSGNAKKARKTLDKLLDQMNSRFVAGQSCADIENDIHTAIAAVLDATGVDIQQDVTQ